MAIVRESWVSALMDPGVGLIGEESPCTSITFMMELHATTSQPTHTQALVRILLGGKFASYSFINSTMDSWAHKR